MGIQIEQLNDALFEGVAAFARQVWAFPDHAAFHRWFLRGPAGTEYYVAHRDGEWLAAIGGIPKTYQNGNKAIDCFETFAWASLDVRAARGLGIKVMKALMDRGKPLVALGGSADTLNYMPRLGFETLAIAPSMVLPLHAAFAGQMKGIKGVLARAGISMLSVIRPPRPPRISDLRIQPMTRLDQQTLDMQSLPGFQARFDASFFEWQAQWPHQGTFLPIRFLRDAEIVGWVFARIAEEDNGRCTGRILEMKFGAETSAADRANMVRATVSAFAGFGAVVARALTSCADTNLGLRACGFRSRTDCPAMIYNASDIARDQPFRVSVLRADGGVLPIQADPIAYSS